MEERKKLSVALHDTILEFQKLGVSRNYAKVLENQLAVIEHRLEAEESEDAKDLRETKQKIEKELQIVRDALKTRH